MSATRDRRSLRFVGGDEATERAFRARWTSGELTEAQRERVVEQRNRPPELVVI